jgi:hypothetical protein
LDTAIAGVRLEMVVIRRKSVSRTCAAALLNVEIARAIVSTNHVGNYFRNYNAIWCKSNALMASIEYF